MEFTRVLCKRTLTSGDPYWWDERVSPPIRHEHDNRMLVEGDWYDIIGIELGGFAILDNQKGAHWFSIYTHEQRMKFPEHCDVYGPRDYAKWFYTPEELEQIEAGTYKQSYKDKHDIEVFPGKLHWVKLKEDEGGNWIIAKCTSKHDTIPGKHNWVLFDGEARKVTDFDLDEIGHKVSSQEDVIEMKDKIEQGDKLQKELFHLVDIISNSDSLISHPDLVYTMPFVKKACDNYFDSSFEKFADLFGEE